MPEEETNAAKAAGFLVCMKMDPGPTHNEISQYLVLVMVGWRKREGKNAPVNLHTKPSAAERPEMRPPEATRSSLYSQFQATRWPLSMMYFSPS